jgi:hypothetical protein
MPPHRAKPLTRAGAKKARLQGALYTRKHRAQQSPEKRAAARARERDTRRRSKKIDEETAANVEVRLGKLKAQAARLGKCIKELQERELENEADASLKEEEPELADDAVHLLDAQYVRLRKHAKHFERATGETPASFDELLALLLPELRRRNYRGEIYTRAPRQQQPRLANHLQLYLCLLWLRRYPTYLDLFIAVGVDELSLHHYLHRVLRALESLEQLKIKWPSEDEFKEQLKNQSRSPFPWLHKVVCVVDGTEIKVGRPAKGALKNAHYSAKKKQYALNVLVITRLDGAIIFCSDPRPIMNDQGFWNELGLRDLFVGKTYGIGADGGFTLNYKQGKRSRDDIIAATPNKRPRRTKKSPTKGKLTAIQKRQNTELSRTRVIIENTNRRLKMYKIVGSKFRHYHAGAEAHSGKGITPALVMRVVAGLTNRYLKRHPLRHEGWQPQDVFDPDDLSVAGSDCDDE